jgi:hypothetical protein
MTSTTGTTTTTSDRLRLLADILDGREDLPPLHEPMTFTFFARTLDAAVHLRDLMTDPAITVKDDVHFPAQIAGTLAGFPVICYIAAAANPVSPPATLAVLNPLLTGDTPNVDGPLCDFCSEAITGTPVTDADQVSWLGIGAARFCSVECREASAEQRVNAAGGA